MRTSQITAHLIRAHKNLQKTAQRVTHTENNKFLYSNYGNWNIKYQKDDINGFVTRDGIINLNGKQFDINQINDLPKVKEIKILIQDMTKMIIDIINNIDNPNIVDRSDKFLKLSRREMFNTAFCNTKFRNK